MTVLFFYFLLCFHVEGVQPDDNEREKRGDDVPSEDDEEKSDTAALNLDDEQPEDDDDANSKKTMFVLYSDTFFTGRQAQPLLKPPKFLIFLNALWYETVNFQFCLITDPVISEQG